METIDSIKKNKEYLKFKYIIKSWEKEFKETHSRTPSKLDYKEAPNKIKHAYKKYFNLKSEALETSLPIDNDDDHSKSTDSLHHIENSDDCFLMNASEPMSSILPSTQELEKILTDLSHQNISPKKENKKTAQVFSPDLSKKLFNRKFSLRNPKKKHDTLNKSKMDKVHNNNNKHDITKCSENFTTQNKEIDSNKETDLNKIDFNKSVHTIMESEGAESKVLSSEFFLKNKSYRHFNEGWIERNTGISLATMPCNDTKKFGISNINVSDVSVTCDYVDNSESEEESNNKTLEPCLKKRKVDNACEKKEYSSNFTSSEIITTNENETLQKKKARKNENVKSLSNKVCHLPPDISDYLPFGIEQQVVPRLSKIPKENIALKNVQNIENDKDINLKTKIKSGTLNENFRKINIEKKVYVKGRKRFNFSKYKKNEWKDKKALNAGMEFPENGIIKCFKCDKPGHMARFCTSHKEDALLALDTCEDKSDLPTLKDMQDFVSSNSILLPSYKNVDHIKAKEIPYSVLKELNFTNKQHSLKPIYTYQENISAELSSILSMFGHDTFRQNQELTIKRILCGMSTLLVLSTGGGKSLCYQIPAYIYSKHYKCITLVISPLVSLMEDQVISMPEFLKAGCLHTNQTLTQRRKIVQCLSEGQLNILLISPEALITADTSNGFSGLFKSMPPIAFACIDEAHCVSQWSHNFRPSYLMICRVLRERLKVNCILGLTATASQSTIQSIISHINISDGFEGVLKNSAVPENLNLSVSREKEKDKALITFLSSEKALSFNSIIVYCIRREECERVASILRSCLQNTGGTVTEKETKKRKRLSYIAEAYHAGMSSAQRKRVQKLFMDGVLKIIVATVAFGMGINKSDIRCIIHYNMPSSFESYIQEVGRAGRDGKFAHCHVFLTEENNDRNEILKHIHSNSVDRSVIRKLLEKVFVSCQCNSKENNPNTVRCSGHEVGIPIDSTVEELDLPAENIATLLCYIELHHKKYIKVLNNCYMMCKISSYGGPTKILEAAKNCLPLSMAYILKSDLDKNVMNKGVFEFNVIDVAAAIGWESGMVKYVLKNLEWVSVNGINKRSYLKVEFHTLGFRINAPGDLNSVELDNMLNDLHSLVILQEKTMLYQLEECQKTFYDLGKYSLLDSTKDNNSSTNSLVLKSVISDYFSRENIVLPDKTIESKTCDEERIKSDISALISTYKDCQFSSRSIAKILQGISTPNYPAIVWGRCKFWRSYLHEDFYMLVKLAAQQIIQTKIR